MRKRPDISFLRSLKPGTVVGADDLLQSNTTTPPKKRGQAKSTNPEQKIQLGLIIHALCQEYNLQYTTEKKFIKGRRWKFDFAIASLKIGIEYEGLQSEKSGHTTLVGYTRNCTKYNAAVLEGWYLLRYTAKNYKDVAIELRALIEKLK